MPSRFVWSLKATGQIDLYMLSRVKLHEWLWKGKAAASHHGKKVLIHLSVNFFYISCKISHFCGRGDERIFPFSALMGLSGFYVGKMDSCSVDCREKPVLLLLIIALPEYRARYLQKHPAMDDETQSCTHRLHSTQRSSGKSSPVTPTYPPCPST